jgi:hypothetical protein
MCVYCVCVFVCVFITAGPFIKLCAGGEGDSERHVLLLVCVFIRMPARARVPASGVSSSSRHTSSRSPPCPIPLPLTRGPLPAPASGEQLRKGGNFPGVQNVLDEEGMFDLCLASLQRAAKGELWRSFLLCAELLEKGKIDIFRESSSVTRSRSSHCCFLSSASAITFARIAMPLAVGAMLWRICSASCGVFSRRSQACSCPTVIAGQTEGLKVGCGGMGGWVGCEEWVDRWAEGEGGGMGGWVGLQRLIWI